MPYTIRSSTAIITQIRPSLEEAAISLNFNEFRVVLENHRTNDASRRTGRRHRGWITLISELARPSSYIPAERAR